MPDDDQQVNCILEVCCGGPDSKQPKALADWLVQHANVPSGMSRQAAHALIGAFDFAPKGSLVAFKTAIAALARGHDYE